MEKTDVKTDRNGWKFYDHLPHGYRLATMDDFHTKGKKKVGMEYLIQRANQQHFEIHAIREETRSVRIKPFLDYKMVFVKSE